MKSRNEIDLILKAELCGRLLVACTMAGALYMAYAFGWMQDRNTDKATETDQQEKVGAFADSLNMVKNNTFSEQIATKNRVR